MDLPGALDLRRYPAAAAAAVAGRLRANLATGLVDPGYVASRLQFRDPAGQAWSIGLRTGRWYRHGAGAWLAADDSPAVLEGPAELARLLPGAGELRSPVPETEAATQVGGRGGLGAVAQAVKNLHDAYLGGSLTSTEVTALLEELALLEPDGTVWAPGFQSGSWYALRPAGWERAAAAPDPQRLQTAAPLSDDLARAVLARLEANPVPEAVAAPWRPVDGYPERLSCHFCRAVQSGEQEICWNCGQPAPLLASVVPAAGPIPAPAAAPAPPASPAAQTPAPPMPVPAPPTSLAPAAWRLILLEGHAPQPSYELGILLALGREADNQVQLADVRASRHHARIERDGEGYRIRDLGSSNGTFLNGVQLTAPAPLRPGDRIQIGDVLFAVQAPGAAAGPPAAGAASAGPYAAPAGPYASAATAGAYAPAAPAIAPAAGPAPARKTSRGPLRWLGIGCLGLLALLASLAACGFFLNLLERF